MPGGAVTPKYIGRIVPAGDTVIIGQHGRYISIISAVPATFTLSIDDESPQQILSGTQIDCEDYKYSRLVFTNVGANPATLIALISETKVSDMRGDNLLAAIAASAAAGAADLAAIEILLTTIETETVNLDVPTSDITALLTTIETETANLDVPLSDATALLTTIETETANLDIPLSDIEADTANLDVAISDTMIPLSTGGGAGQIALTVSGGATPNGGGPNQAMREIMFWTAGALVYCTIDAAVGNAANTHFLMVPNREYTFPVANGQIVRFHNDDPANAVIIYHIWRN
jgi:hypothetical protein